MLDYYKLDSVKVKIIITCNSLHCRLSDSSNDMRLIAVSAIKGLGWKSLRENHILLNLAEINEDI